MRAIKKILHLSNASTGSAIIYAMVAGAAVSLGFVMLMSQTQKVEQDIRMISNSTKYRQLHRLIKDNLMNSKTCTAALSGKSISAAFTPAGMSLLPFNLNIFNSTQTLDSNWRSPMGNHLDDIRLYITEADLKVDLKRDIPSSPNFNVIRGKVHLLTKKGTPGLKTPKHDHLIMDMMIYYTNDTDQHLYSCFSDRREEAMCTLSGGIFNSYAAITGQTRCEPEKVCRLAQTSVVADPALCVAPFVAKQIGETQYFCMWCNQNYTPVPPPPLP